ncbi:hypothetical protein BSKO_00705 [Bryopsis sp. KO-2023]|nr:hypothetical protein BSKO_00705 [Bryopsis sp. KO-2023]
MPFGRKRKLFGESDEEREETGVVGVGERVEPFALRYVREREVGIVRGANLIQQAKERFFGRQLSVINEREFDSQGYDKAFAAAWLDGATVLVGTKCNQLLKLDVDGKVFSKISLGNEAATAEAVGRDVCGIHSVVLNPSETLVATGGPDPKQCAVFDTQGLTRQQLFEGHRDWVFGMDWLDDEHFVSGSRDKSVKIWKFDPTLGPVAGPVGEHSTTDSHEAKVRDVKYCKAENAIISVSLDGKIRTWDPDRLECMSEFELNSIHRSEIACTAVKDSLLAVGCRDWIAMVDLRMDHQYWALELVHPDFSVRSLQYHDDVLSCGTGNGWISFIDVRRSQRYMELERPVCRGKAVRTDYHLEVGEGTKTDGPFWHLLEGVQTGNAVYAHCWDRSRSRMFACGGPLSAGLKGCYMGVWE